MGRPLSVLVVEDEFLIADEIASILEGAGHRVVGPAASIADAIRVVAGEPAVDVAVLDANLRGQSSLPVADALRGRNVPFCVCSGYRSNDLLGRFGDVEVVEKPINQGRLLALLERLVAGR